MAKEPAQIPKEPEIPESQDYAFLKRTGIDLAQELAGDVWTDYNEHDPGVTILEQLCFAITELSYKTGMTVEELLYAKRAEPFDSRDNAFYTSESVFPSAALSVNDYRTLLIDQLYPNVRNAWLVPLESGAFGVNMSGLYEVSLILDEYTEESRKEVRDAALRLLAGQRGLCEDFEEIRVLEPLRLSVFGIFDVNPKFMVESVVAEILYRVSLEITPEVRFRSREELEEEGWNVEEIFEGPLPKHGFIDRQSLKTTGNKPVWTITPSARLMNLLREVEGVDRIVDVQIGVYLDQHELPEGYQLVEKLKGDKEHDGYYITNSVKKLPRGHELRKIKKPQRDLPVGLYPIREEENVPKGYFPKLDVATILDNRMIITTVEGLEYEYETANVRKNLDRLRSEKLVQYQHKIIYPEYRGRSRRTEQDIAYYYSIQNQFPEVYGIGTYGVKKDRPLEWQTHARHLKAYLFFYEQILANFLSQLSNFHKLFSLKDEVETTYFHQVPEIPNRNLVLRPDQDEAELKAVVSSIARDYDPINDRRNRSLDHLLARFGEEFLSGAYNALMRNGIEENQQLFQQELIKAKLRFLRNVVELGRDRGRGMDYLSFEGGDSPNDLVHHTTALQKRLALLFNMKDHQHVSMSESIREADGVAFSKKAKAKNAKGKSAFTFSAKNRDALSAVLKEGLNRENFVIRENEKKKGEFQIFFGGLVGRGANDPVYSGASEEKCEAAITALIKRLRELNAASEGFHLVEHVLLRPVGSVMHTWYLVQEGRIFLETPVMETENFEAEFTAALKRRGLDTENYITTGNADDGYTLVLTDEDGTIIAYREGYLDEFSAERECAFIVEDIIPNIGDAEEGVIIRKEQHIPKGALLADDFYSLQISAILPSWPVRFRHEKFRGLFEQVIKLSVPAHSKVTCFWVDLAEMADFERIFLEWRTEKAKLKPKQPWLDELSWCLVVLLKFFANPNNALVIKELAGLRDKHGLSMKFGDEQ